MQINLFVCNAEKNRVDKNNYLGNRFAIDGVIKDTTSAVDILIKIEKTNPLENNYNYLYVPDFKRWYFITDIINVHNKIWVIKAHVDVLQTFKNDIKTSMAIIDKNELQNISNVYYDDGSFISDVRKDIQIIEFDNGFNDNGSNILICAGGV